MLQDFYTAGLQFKLDVKLDWNISCWCQHQQLMFQSRVTEETRPPIFVVLYRPPCYTRLSKLNAKNTTICKNRFKQLFTLRNTLQNGLLRYP